MEQFGYDESEEELEEFRKTPAAEIKPTLVGWEPLSDKAVGITLSSWLTDTGADRLVTTQLPLDVIATAITTEAITHAEPELDSDGAMAYMQAIHNVINEADHSQDQISDPNQDAIEEHLSQMVVTDFPHIDANGQMAIPVAEAPNMDMQELPVQPDILIVPPLQPTPDMVAAVSELAIPIPVITMPASGPDIGTLVPGMHDEVAMFWLFVDERNEIWHKREIEKLPQAQWTDDTFMQKSRFCNVYRELDFGTRFLFEQVLMREGQSISRRECIERILVYRFFNNVQTWTNALYGTIDNPNTYNDLATRLQHIDDGLRQHVGNNFRLYTDAYVARYCPPLGGTDDVANAGVVIQAILQAAPDIELMLEQPILGKAQSIFHRLLEIPAFGKFLSYQCLTDMSYPYNTGKVGPYVEINDYISLSPAATAAIQLTGVVGGEATYQNFANKLWTDQEDYFSRVGLEFKKVKRYSLNREINQWEIVDEPLSLANIGHCLGEYYRYRRLQDGGELIRPFKPDQNPIMVWSRLLPGWGDPYKTTE